VDRRQAGARRGSQSTCP